MARLTYKTDFKFGLLVLAILIGTYLFAAHAVRSNRLLAGDIEAKLHRLMTRKQVEDLFHKHRGVRIAASTSNSVIYTIEDPGGLRNNYHFNFDPHERLVVASVDDEYRPGYFTNRMLILK